jgi:predicted dehydrogenase
METQQLLKKYNMKICLIGYGYWGNILHKNLTKIGYNDIQIVDISLNNLDLISDEFDYFFISTPFKTHRNILLKLSKYKNKRVWCEKPLVEGLDELNEIYRTMEINDNLLFVDWTYTFNPCIFRLKEIIKEKKLKQIILNRTNKGPVRYDCNSLHDLSSHDLSILYFLFDKEEFNFNFNEFSITDEVSIGSSVSWCYKNGMQVLINSSWEHETKNRVSIFITQEDEIVVFDDIKKIINNNGTVENFELSDSPIENAMNYFFKSDNFLDNKEITTKITKNLETIYEHKI